MKNYISFFAAVLFQSYAFAQSNCFENCLKNFENSNLEGPERNMQIVNQLIGCQMPELVLKSVSGEEFSIRKLKGKVIVINFWFASCAPCIAELPALNKLVDEYKGKDVVFLALGRESIDAIRSFSGKREFKYNLISANDDIFEKSCVIAGWPMNMVVDKDGVLKYVHSGGFIDERAKEYAYKEMKPVIDKCLQL
ncbi:MAG: TlpA family protein disulfide reductase [Cyclobacteriaceae bacterium]|jgi:peroxiredoxin|nr:TlpA family protein disulfide reductase [Flammeovirgaceae bacterium]